MRSVPKLNGQLACFAPHASKRTKRSDAHPAVYRSALCRVSTRLVSTPPDGSRPRTGAPTGSIQNQRIPQRQLGQSLVARDRRPRPRLVVAESTRGKDVEVEHIHLDRRCGRAWANFPDAAHPARQIQSHGSPVQLSRRAEPAAQRHVRPNERRNSSAAWARESRGTKVLSATWSRLRRVARRTSELAASSV